MHKILIDTCIWLDLVTDYRAAPIVYALEELRRYGKVSLVVPELVIEEFDRNRERVVEVGRRGLISHVRLVRQAISNRPPGKTRDDALMSLSSIDFEVGALGENEPEVVKEVESLLKHPMNIRVPVTIEHKARAATRALEKVAPFHREKNSIADAVLLEIFTDQLPTQDGNTTFAFVTRNFRDFSDPKDHRLPHPDLRAIFGQHAEYVIDLAAFVEQLDPELVADHDLEVGLTPPFRSLTELLDAEQRLFRQVWYNRHQNFRCRIESGEVKVVPEGQLNRNPFSTTQVAKTTWSTALKAAKRTEREVGIENLGPWDDFEWGMINGKLSALRWVLGDDWDMLDT